MGFDITRRLMYTNDPLDTSFDHLCYTDDNFEDMTTVFESYIDTSDSITESQELFSSDNFNDTE